jgi:polysaccharide export outer membrane protein
VKLLAAKFDAEFDFIWKKFVENRKNNMKNTLCRFVGGLALAGLASASLQVNAQVGRDSASKVDEWKRLSEEYRQAQQEVLKNRSGTVNIQRELDKLAEKKVNTEREIEYIQTKFNAAQRAHAAASKAGSPEETDKWNREVTGWDVRLKAAKDDLAKMETQTQDLIRKLQDQMKGVEGSNIIVPGDALQIFVLEDDTFNGLYQVRRGGYVILPRVGRVSVAGKDLSGAEKAIKDSLEATQLRQGTVMIERTRGGLEEDGAVVYLAGEFQTPGPMRLPAGYSPTLVTAVLRAGGTTPSADLKHVRLLRLEGGKALVEEVDVAAILEGTGLQSDLSLEAGDIVVVPAFAPIIYVTGNVKSPRTLRLYNDEDLTAYSAILRADGFARFAKLTGVYVVRDHGNGEKTKIPVNIKDVQAGKAPDVVLKGKDIVVVPEKFFSF